MCYIAAGSIVSQVPGLDADGWDVAPSIARPSILADRYVLGPLIGRGGAAEVFRARDLDGDGPVAVKLFRAGVPGIEQRRQQREILALLAMDHPGLISLRHAGIHHGRRYLVMDFVNGSTLRERLVDAPLRVAEVIEIGRALADALAYVHARGMVHRDVKPANVLLDESGPRLVDFGLAQLSDATRMTAIGFTLGTPAYLAPEQVRGEKVQSAADVYALGLVLLECLTGHTEYPGGPVEAAVARLHRRPAVPAHLPPGLRDLLADMTAPKAAARPTAAAVAAVLSGLQLEPGHTTIMQVSRRRRIGALAAAAGVLAAMALVAGITLGATSGPSSTLVAGGPALPPAATDPPPSTQIQQLPAAAPATARPAAPAVHPAVPVDQEVRSGSSQPRADDGNGNANKNSDTKGNSDSKGKAKGKGKGNGKGNSKGKDG